MMRRMSLPPTSVAHPMAKVKLVVCCDGTSNSEYLGEDKSPLTNVSRISRAIRQFDTDHEGCRQIVTYIPGIGTDESNILNGLNQGLGVGLKSQIKEAYTFLCHNYNEGDDIILIGFSRGAFAVRCLIDFIIDKGLLNKETLIHLPKLFTEWMEQPETGKLVIDPPPRRPSIQVCALWDTVNSVGFPRPWPGAFGRPIPQLAFVNSDIRDPPVEAHNALNRGGKVRNVFQAISLFEHRFYFHPIVLRLRESQKQHCRLEQCWFSGYHGDIGGGNDKEALAHFALAWMMVKLKDFLTIEESTFWHRKDNKPTWVLPDDIDIPDSYYSWWGWRAAGSSHRTPRIDFWNSAGRIEPLLPDLLPQDYNDLADVSRETIHSSVRFMAQRNYMLAHFNKCQSVKNKQISEQMVAALGSNRWVWKIQVSAIVIAWWKKIGAWFSGPWTRIRRWRSGAEEIAEVVQAPHNLWEHGFPEDEKRLLITWVDAEWTHLRLEDSQLGDPSPGTIIKVFKAWVLDPLKRANDVPVPELYLA